MAEILYSDANLKVPQCVIKSSRLLQWFRICNGSVCNFFEWINEFKLSPTLTPEDNEQYMDMCHNYEADQNARQRQRGEDLIWRTDMER
jgi:hypothetical protein